MEPGGGIGARLSTMEEKASEVSSSTCDRCANKCRIRDGTRFSQWLDDTTAHGIVHVFKAPSLLRRFLWGIVFSIACILLAVTVVDRVRFYFSFTTATTISLETDLRAIPFPSVTVCNMNPMRLSDRALHVSVQLTREQ